MHDLRTAKIIGFNEGVYSYFGSLCCDAPYFHPCNIV